MHWRIDIKRFILLLLALSLAVLAIRGCIFARKCGGKTCDGCDSDCLKIEPGDKAKSVYIDVFDRSSGKKLHMELEDYIGHVVAAEMPASFKDEALKAQAVAARTFAVRRMKLFGGTGCSNGCDVCTDSTCCQAFLSSDSMRSRWGDDYDEYRSKVMSAAENTSGIIAVYDGKPIEALYHSTSGGYTEDSQNVFSQAQPYLKGVYSPGEEDSSKFSSVTEISRSRFAKAINASCKKAGLSASKLEKQVSIVSRFDSGRVKSVKVGGAVMSGREFRTALGLNSANFTLEFAEKKVRIKTIGYGHGVGMSQQGANAMARDGATFDEILTHYYTGIELTDISRYAK